MYSGDFDKSHLKWIFFDLDDTLWDFSANSIIALRSLYDSESGLRELFPDFADFDLKYHKENAELWSRYHHGEISSGFLRSERFARMISTGGDRSEAVISESLRLNDRYLSMLACNDRVVDGAFELLEHLKGRYLIGVVTNGFLDVQYKKLAASGLCRYVQRMIVSDEIGVQKPDARIFNYALEETGAASTEVIMVGDNPDADIAGAVGAGWRTVYFNKRGENLPQYLVDRVPEINSLEELSGL